MTLHCAKCGHQWEMPLKLPMEMRRAALAITGFAAAGCPSCGADGKSVLCGTSPAPAASDGRV
jgi:hypothetical protein